MAKRDRLSTEAAAEELAALDGWSIEDGKLHKKFTFEDFPSAFAFMTRVAFEAERLDHHPNWTNVWAHVHVTLWTHDVDGLTELDFKLAAAMDRVVR
jgi:4a-hydroxytetrahydrobiopterin dehydratase